MLRTEREPSESSRTTAALAALAARAVGRVQTGEASSLVAAGFVPFVAYVAALAAFDQVRWDHAGIAVSATVLCLGNDSTRRFFAHVLPFMGLFVVYDAMRFWPVDPASVLTCSLRDAELLLFGTTSGGVLSTPGEQLARLANPVLDLLCAIPYGLYVPIMLGQWISLYVTRPLVAKRFAIMALSTHLLGFVTYHVAPAAPPWYVASHGCAVDPFTMPDPAGLVRVDALLGTTYFHDLYSRGATPFGALPSLHAAYPLYGLCCTFAVSGAGMRALQIGYAALMAFSAVYLGHHYVLDVLLGVLYALVSFEVARRIVATDPPAEPPSSAGRIFGPRARRPGP